MIRSRALFIVFIITAELLIPYSLFAQTRIVQPVISGDFLFAEPQRIYSGHFFQTDRSDLLVLQNIGKMTIDKGFAGGGIIETVFKLTLYSFDGKNFQPKWESDEVFLQHSDPTYPIATNVWCFGDFNGDGIDELVIFYINYAFIYKFNLLNSKKPDKFFSPVSTIEKSWVDQAIGCDINDDGKDEIITLEFISGPKKFAEDVADYQVGIYSVYNDSLAQLWKGLKDVGLSGNYVTPPDQFLSAIRMNGFIGEVPLLMKGQSDVSSTEYFIVNSDSNGSFIISRPFPAPERNSSPVGVPLFDYQGNIYSYGEFWNANPDKAYYEWFGFGLFKDNGWVLLDKVNPVISGKMCRFLGEQNKEYWLFIYNQKFSIYDREPFIMK